MEDDLGWGDGHGSEKEIGVAGNFTGCFDCAPAAAFATGRSAQHDVAGEVLLILIS